jgi:anaerobic ribonucleoside-triphosphate reductase activating protein
MMVMEQADVLVDGKFEKEKKDVNYHWAGSTNQRIIDIQKSIKEGQVILYDNK